jgi:hypothetical protein
VAYDVGTAHLRVVPSFSGVESLIKNEAKKWGASAGKAFGDSFNEQVKTQTDRAPLGPGKPQSQRQGQDSGGAFADGFKKRVEASLKSLPDVTIGAATNEAEQKLRDLSAQLQALSDKKVGVDLDSGTALAEIQRLEQELTTLGRESPDIQVRVDAAAAASQLALLSREVAKLDGKDVDVQVDVDSGRALLQLAQINNAANNAGSGISAMTIIGAAIGPAIVPAAAAAAAAIVALGVTAAGAGAALGVISLGFSGVSDAVGALEDAEKGAAESAKKIGAAQDQVKSAVEGVKDAEENLTRVRQSNARAQQDAARGVIDAQKGVAAAEKDAADSAEDAARRVADAERGVQDARERAADAAESAAQRVVDAERAVEQSRRDAAVAVAEAGRRVKDSEEDLVRAQRDAAEVTRDLTEARRSYKEQMEDLDSSIKSNALSQKEANLQIAAAQAELNKVLNDPRSSDAQQEAAQIRYDREVLQLEDLQRRGERLAAQQEEANAKGVEGSDQVVAARQRIADADEKVKDAQAGVQKAIENQAKTRQDGADRIAATERSLDQARKAQSKAQQDGIRSIADAQRKLADAQRSQDETRIEGIERVQKAQDAVAEARRRQSDTERAGQQAVADAQKRIADAQQQVVKAQLALNDAQQSGAQKLKEALDGITPTQLKFAQFIVGLKKQFLDLKEVAAAGFLPNIQAGLSGALLNSEGKLKAGILGFVSRVSTAIGGVVDDFFKRLSGPGFQSFFALINKTAGPTITRIGTAVNNVIEGFANLFVAFAPLTAKIETGIVNLSAKFLKFTEDLGKSPGFQKFLGYVERVGPVIIDILGNVFKIAGNLAIGLAPLGEVVLGLLDKFTGYLAKLSPATIAKIAGAFVLLVGAVKGLSILSSIITFVIGIITNGGLLVAFIRTTLMPALSTFFTFLFTNPIGLVIVAIVALIAGLVLLYKNSETARKIIQAAWQGIQTAAKFMWEQVIKPAFEALVAFVRDKVIPIITWLWNNIIKPYFKAIGDAIAWAWNNVIKPVFDAIVYVLKTFVFPIIKLLYEGIVKPIFTLIKIAIQVAWAAIKIVFGLLEIYFKAVLFPIFKFLYEKVVKPVFNSIKDTISTVWNKGIKPIFEALGNFIKDKVAPVFKKGVDAIAAAWNKVKDVAKIPIKFIIETVLNKGIIAGYNKLAGAFGVTPVKDIALPKGWATGGVLPGYTPGRDPHVFHSPTGGAIALSGGEAIMRPEFTRAVGPAWVSRANQIARTGGIGAVKRSMGKFANGGIVGYKDGGWLDDLGELFGKAKKKAGQVFGGIKDFVTDPIGSLKKLAEGLYATMPGKDTGFGKVALGLPKKMVGWATDKIKSAIAALTSSGDLNGQGIGAAGMMKLLRARFPGLPLISGFRPGATTLSGNKSYHSRDMAVDVAPRRDVAQFIHDTYKSGTLELITPFQDLNLYKGKPHTYTGAVWNQHNFAGGNAHVHWAYAQAQKILAGIGTGQGVAAPAQVRNWINSAMGAAGVNGPLWLQGMLTLTKRESGWNPNAINRTDSNARAGIPSQGLAQVIPPTFNAYRVKSLSNNILNPVANVAAAIRYILSRYGGNSARPGYVQQMDPNARPHGYDSGGYLPPGYSTVYNGTGRPEPVFTDAQWALMKSGGMGGGSMDIRLRVDDGSVVQLVDVRVDNAMGTLADAQVYLS